MCGSGETPLPRYVTQLLANSCFVAVTADHGNAGARLPCDSSPNWGIPRPQCPSANRDRRGALPQLGSERPPGYRTLADVAPTLLEADGPSIPSEMTGTPLAIPGSGVNPECVMVLMDGWEMA